jgi:hypothetical protein
MDSATGLTEGSTLEFVQPLSIIPYMDSSPESVVEVKTGDGESRRKVTPRKMQDLLDGQLNPR